jgi:hypothetical protein
MNWGIRRGTGVEGEELGWEERNWGRKRGTGVRGDELG